MFALQMSKLKIAYIGQRGVPPTFGGPERYVDEIVRRLPKGEVETYTYCRRHYVQDTDIDYTTQIFVPSLEAKGLEAFSHSFFCSLDTLRLPVDIVHFQALGPSLFSCIPRVKGVKIIATVHGLDWQRAKWGRVGKVAIKSGESMMAHTASAIIAVSKKLRSYYENQYKKDVFYVPIGFSEPKLLEISKVKEKYGLEPFKYILFLSRIVPEKGIHYLIEAFKNMRRDDYTLVIAGHAFQGDRYLKYIKSLAGNDSSIIFTDYVTREEVHELYTNAYCFVLPSELEGMAAVILEAMSHKCPVLISDIEENVDVIAGDERVYGFLHKNKDVIDLQKQMTYLLDHPEVVNEMRELSYNFVNKEYSWDKAVRMTYDVYKHVMQENNA